MSTFQQKRCGHCGVRYSYQTSGYGGLQEYNSDTYCQDCYKFIQEALKVVPARSRPDWVGTSDVSAESLVEQERAAWDAAKAEGKVPVRRVLSPMFDMERPDNHHAQGIVHRDGRTYRYEYWTQQGGVAAGRVYLEVERDALTGEILGPWSLKDRWTTPPTFIEHPPWPEKPPATHKFVPMPLTSLPVRRFDIIERSPPLPVSMSREWGPVGRNSFMVEPLPQGALPIYDKDPDVAAYVTGKDPDDEGSDT